MTQSDLKIKLPYYIQLTRLDKPIGVALLMWPTLMGLWVAGNGNPDEYLVLIFILGVVIMRSAGCVINDYADRHIDHSVARTQFRPLTSGKVHEKEALSLFALLCSCAFVLVLFTNGLTILMSIAALALASTYPFMKRYTHLPQVVLGAAFAWAIPMAFTAQTETVSSITWILYLATVLWTVAYDTQYAMVDRDDDLKIGVRSTAILFGSADRLVIGLLQLATLFLLKLAGDQAGLGGYFDIALILTFGLFVYQQHLIKDRERDGCFKAFLNNHWAGMVLFFGMVLEYGRQGL
ncbi:4-hydroxybenzoate polyprenyl transferase [Oleiphilus messinensis]|uniref:4-hydroxybenzoate octaprenyltransferase n=1 Tax=Oleiphilus messinensis TaxID=141451 RepID=A0A1Y0IE06_9GAMM|nr:4-hydroxybenzoate octaprenyltransferase [Oleiphilus messinensis]ARU58757.1 4-hydroxybenzoate polyprenyl transferase [Oleiphilus messinensis]